MASTYLSLHYHLVFGTKKRDPFIAPQWGSRLHEYLGGTISGLGGFPQAVGGVADHVHVLVGLKATHCLADVLRELKKASSVWVHEAIGLQEFAWQEGYAAFTVSPTARRTEQARKCNSHAPRGRPGRQPASSRAAGRANKQPPAAAALGGRIRAATPSRAAKTATNRGTKRDPV